MTPKEWFALLLFYGAYLLLGASVFNHVEYAREVERREDELAERIEINELLTKHLAPDDQRLQDELLDRLSDYCGSKVTNYTDDEFEEPYKWDFYHAFYFCLFVCTTIGYGNIAPTNMFGRLFVILYALIGIPVNGFVFTYMGDYFGQAFIRVYHRYKAYKLSESSNFVARKFNLLGQIMLYLIPGLFICLLGPACVFSYVEDWPYDVSVYYAFISLTTVGFGDYVTTFKPTLESEYGVWFTVYRIFVIAWFFTAIGYIFMILGFVAKGMSHKKIKRLEKALAMNIRETQQKVWHGVTKDISYLRKILNEVYLLKFKPVYDEPEDKLYNLNLNRSDSCPELSIYRSPETPTTSRKRANSESMLGFRERSRSIRSGSVWRRLSDTALHRINKEKTFGVQALVQPAELLARVVTALGNITATNEDDQSILERASINPGINCFSDSQILASERTWSGWSLTGSDKSSYLNVPPRGRPRAASDIGLTPHHMPQSNEWTWSGGDDVQIQEIMQIRQKTKSKNDLLRAALSNNANFDSSFTINVPPTSEEAKISEAKVSILQRLNPFRKRSATPETKHPLADAEAPPVSLDSYLATTTKGRGSMFNIPSQYLTSTSTGRQSALSMPPADEHLLETTTIGDLLRALELLHTHTVTADPRRTMADPDGSPKRKLGTASPPQLPSLLTLFTPPIEGGSRRGSLKPPLMRSNSNDSNTIERRPSFRPVNPPPYSSALRSSSPTSGPAATGGGIVAVGSPKPIRRRFSVRPSNLAYPPGHCPRPIAESATSQLTSSSQSLYAAPATTVLQRRLPSRPSPLVVNQNHLTVPSPMGGTNLGPLPSGQYRWRPVLLRADSEHFTTQQMEAANANLRMVAVPRSRHSSLSSLFDPKRKDIS